MSKIRIISSNFLDAKSPISFEDARFKYASAKFPDHFKWLHCKDIKTLTYEKPDSQAGRRARGLFSEVRNIFSAVKSMKLSKQIEFNVHFKDGKYLAGVTSMDEYFEIQNAWLEVK